MATAGVGQPARMELAGVVGPREDSRARIQSELEGAAFGQKDQLVELLIYQVIVIDDEVKTPVCDPERVEFKGCKVHLKVDSFVTGLRLRCPRLCGSSHPVPTRGRAA